VTILGGGPGLGFYVPGAILARQLCRKCPVELAVIESLLPADKQNIVVRSRQAFHQDFRVALMAQRVVKDISGDLDAKATHGLLEKWSREGRRSFIVFSGFWGPIMARYIREFARQPVQAD